MSKPHVVLVEDEEDIGLLLRAVLTDYKVEVVSSNFARLLGPEAWSNVQVAIIDISLGEDTSGLDILRYLKQNHPEITRVAYTAVDRLALRAEAVADTVLQKPAPVEDIIKAVKWSKS